jgi:hypothetical protein
VISLQGVRVAVPPGWQPVEPAETATSSIEGRCWSWGTAGVVDVAQSALDLELRYRPAAQVDADRFVLHTQQLRVDAAAQDLDGVTGEVAVLEWIRDRLSAPGRRAVDAGLRALRAAADARNLGAAADHAARLAARVRALSPG